MPVAELNPKSQIGNQKSDEVVVSIRGLTKVFKDFWNRPKARAVDGVDFEVRRGEIFGLLGPNGSGKSTTIKLLLGLLHPTKGHIEVFGHSPRHVQTKARIGYLPEESYLYRYLISRETLDFFGNLFHLDKNERNNRAEQLLDMVGLGKTQTRAVGEFSKGMQRRIGLAQALINDPDLVILDEPTAGLDPIGCREGEALTIVALARRGKTASDLEQPFVVRMSWRTSAIPREGDLLRRQDPGAGHAERTAGQARQPAHHHAGAPARDTGKSVGHHPQRPFDRQGRSGVDNPTQNLESYFLDVVAKARAANAKTSGAQSGALRGRYLRGGVEARPAGEKVLEKLSLPQAVSGSR